MFFFLFFSFFATTVSPFDIDREQKFLSKAEKLVLVGDSSQNAFESISQYESAILDQSFQRLSISSQVPIFLKLAASYEKTGNKKKQLEILSELLSNPLYSPFSVDIKIAYGEYLLLEKKGLEAEKIFQKLLRIPSKSLSLEERHKIHHFAYALSAFYTESYEQAFSFLLEHEYTQAIPLYEMVAKALKNGHFPKNSSPLFKKSLSLECHFLLSLSLYLFGEKERSQHILEQVLEESRIIPFSHKEKAHLLSSLLKEEEEDLDEEEEIYTKEKLSALIEFYFLSKNEKKLRELSQHFSAVLSSEQKELIELIQSDFNLQTEKGYLLKGLSQLKHEAYEHALESFQKAHEKGLYQKECAKLCLLIPDERSISFASDLLNKEDEESLYLLIQSRHSITDIENFIALYPDSEHLPEVLHAYTALLLPTNKKQTLEIASTLLEDFPEYPARDQILYIASMLIEEEYLDKAKAYLKELIHDFPHSIYAGESFFRLISEKEYARKAPFAIQHLATLIDSYPTNRYAIPAHYYLGISHDVKDHFYTVLALYKEKELADSYFLEFYFSSLLELGKRGDQNALEELLKKKCTTEALYILSQYALYEDSFEKKLDDVIEFDKKNEKPSEFSIYAFLDKAQIYVRKKLYTEAMHIYEKAEEEAKKLSRELLLKVYIQKSECLKNWGKYGDAMKLLSFVANDPSPSQLRIHALFLRAELYEINERYDLAIKQLEACEKKGGEWGKRARDKLEKTYGYHEQPITKP